MRMLRHLPTNRLLLLLTGIVAVLAGGTAIAAGALGGDRPKPPAKSLAAALHDAAAATPVDGVTARITFTNKLIAGSTLGQGSNPLITGAKGRLWAAADGRLRLELQSDAGDAQIVSDGKTATVYDATSNTVYKVTLPADKPGDAKRERKPHAPPSVAEIEKSLRRVAGEVSLSGAIPDNVAGQEAYTVKLSPAHHGGLVGGARLAWDAANGTPLRAVVYAAGTSKPVLGLTADDISFGPVPAADLSAMPPAGAKVVKIALPAHPGTTGDKKSGERSRGKHEITGARAVAARLPFKLSAPGTLAGMTRTGVRLVASHKEKGALVTYGAGLGGIAVFEQAATEPLAAKPAPAGGRHRHDHGALSIPTKRIAGTDGQELSTALGTLVRFQRAGVRYTIVGSIPAATAEAAARGL